jgi:hypothetical protein
MFNNFFFRKSCRLWDNVEKCSRDGQATDGNMAYAHCVMDTYGYKICNTYCLSSATMVARKRLHVTLCVHFCLVLDTQCSELGATERNIQFLVTYAWLRNIFDRAPQSGSHTNPYINTGMFLYSTLITLPIIIRHCKIQTRWVNALAGSTFRHRTSPYITNSLRLTKVIHVTTKIMIENSQIRTKLMNT